MHLRRYWDTPFFVELALLALVAPVLYFPGRFEGQDLIGAVGILAAAWIWRRLIIGIWYRRTPADWPLFFLLLVMLPISLWAAPAPLRQEYAIPRALILIWNFALFWTIVSHVGRRRELYQLAVTAFAALGVAIAVASVFGTQWSNKFPLIGPLLERIPKPLAGLFSGTDSGFNPNQVGGTLLYVLPLLVALAVYGLVYHRQRLGKWLPAALAALTIGSVLILTQSRGSLLGLGVALVFMLLIHWRWGRWLLVAGGVAAVIGLALIPLDSLSGTLESAENVQEVTGVLTLAGRMEIWNRALYGIGDFPFTGMGLGTFRKIVHLLYPLFTIPPDIDFAHAHNFFFQMALDFGIPGLVSLLALYGIAGVQLSAVWKRAQEKRGMVVGLLGVLVGQSVYSMADAVTMGAKVNLFFWLLFALILALRPDGALPQAEANPRQTASD